MALIKCPECGAEISDKAAACPRCGFPIAQSRPPQPEPETVLYRGSPVMFRNRPGSFLLCLLLVAAGLGLAIVTLQRGSAPLAGVPAPVLLILSLVLAAAGLIILLVWWLVCRNIRLEVTDKQTSLRTGLLSKNTIELAHKNIRSVVVRQSFIQRILGVGTLELSSSAESDFEIAVHGLRDPQKVADLIQQYQE